MNEINPNPTGPDSITSDNRGGPLSRKELEGIVAANENEVIGILYVLAAKRWGDAHIATAKCEAEIAEHKACKEYLELIIENLNLIRSKGDCNG